MPNISLIAVAAGTLALFLIGGGYYAALGSRLATAGSAAEAAPPWTYAVELGRCLVLALVVTGLVAQGDIEGAGGGLLLGLVLWIGFPFVLWVGAVVHEHTPVTTAAIHAGDWLIKLMVLGALVALVD